MRSGSASFRLPKRRTSNLPARLCLKTVAMLARAWFSRSLTTSDDRSYVGIQLVNRASVAACLVSKSVILGLHGFIRQSVLIDQVESSRLPPCLLPT